MKEAKYQTLWRRILAITFDFYLVGLPLLPISRFIWSCADELHPVAVILWSAFHSLAFLLYRIILHAISGQTVGKLLFGVRVVCADTTSVDIKKAFLRDVVPLSLCFLHILLRSVQIWRGWNFYDRTAQSNPITTVWEILPIVWWLSTFLAMVFSAKRIGLHDRIAGTTAIRYASLFARGHRFLKSTDEKHASLGISSFILSVVSAILMVFNLIMGGCIYATSSGGIDVQSTVVKCLGLLFVLTFLAQLVGVALGVAALCQKGQKQIFSVLGIGINAAFVLGLIFFIILGRMP